MITKEPVWTGKVKGKKGEIEITLFKSRLPEKEFTEQHRYYQLVAKSKEGEEIGWADYGHSPLSAVIGHIAVDEIHREKGIGKKLCDFAIEDLERAVEKNPPFDKGISVGVKEEKTAMMKIIMSHGFKPDLLGWRKLPKEESEEK